MLFIQSTFVEANLQLCDEDILITFSDINDSIWKYLQNNNTVGIKSAVVKKLTKMTE